MYYDIGIKGLIDSTSTITKKGMNNYTNGNVKVIIPCPSEY